MEAIRKSFMKGDKPLNVPARSEHRKPPSVIEVSSDEVESVHSGESDSDAEAAPSDKAGESDSDAEVAPRLKARRAIVIGSSDEDEEEDLPGEDSSDDEIISVPSVAPPRVSKQAPPPAKAPSSKPPSQPHASKVPATERAAPLKTNLTTPAVPGSFPLNDAGRRGDDANIRPSKFAQPPPARKAESAAPTPIFAPKSGMSIPPTRAGPSRPPASVRDAEKTPAFEIFAPKTGQVIPPAPRARVPTTTVDANGEEYFDTGPAVGMEWEVPKSAQEVEAELRNFLAGAVGIEETTKVDMTQAVVPGLAEGVLLKPHQVISRNWMREREEGKKRGGILADDMGLGKTIQVIVRVWEGRSKGQPPTLIIVPTSVVTQWREEFEKFAPKLRVLEHHGTNRTRNPADLLKYHVIVSSYPVVQSEHKKYTEDGSAKASKSARAQRPLDALFRVEFHRVVLDEAHTIKNRLAQTTKACWALQSPKRWCLTGTPLQNNVDELFPLLCFIGLAPLNDWDEFKQKISVPIKKGKTGGAMKRLHVVLKPTMLRRLKTDMLDGEPLVSLPGRDVAVVVCEFDEEERAFYTALQDKMQLALNKFIEAGTVMNNYTAVLTLLLRLRQACNHPKLVTKDFAKGDLEALEAKPAENRDLPDVGSDPTDELAAAMANLAVERTCSVCLVPLPPSTASSGTCADCSAQIDRQQRRKSLVSRVGPSSAKIRKVIELLREIEDRDEGEKTIVFSQFTSWFDIMEDFLVEEGIKFVRLDGSMKKPDREVALQKIKTSRSVKVILVSFKAGSTGLNLTCCNNVILVDLWWNPALEEQAFDRAHRMGQTRDVKIYKLTIEETVEDRILALQETKRELARAALSGEKMKGNKLGLEDLMKLFRPGGDDDEDET